jgi:hypothetical protein
MQPSDKYYSESRVAKIDASGFTDTTNGVFASGKAEAVPAFDEKGAFHWTGVPAETPAK